MLVHDYTYIRAPAGAIRTRLVEGAHGWIDRLATNAAAKGDALRLRLGPRGTHGPVAKEITVEVGRAVPRGGATLVPLTWHATGAPLLFPVFTGDIEIAAIGGDETELSIFGHYDPPLGAVGEMLDRGGLHRIAEASVRVFLLELARILDDPPVSVR